MKKLLCFFLCLALCGGVLCAPAQAAGFPVPESVVVTAASAYFVNLDTGIPVVATNEHAQRSIASLTKLMTVLLLVENISDLDGTVITAPVDIYVPPVTGGQASSADIRPREQVTARSLLYAMLLPSGNEAAAVTAFYLGKENLQNFYAMMNARAKDLGCKDTNFTNPHGLGDKDEGNYSSAYDMFLIAQECWKHDVVREAAGTARYWMPMTNLHTTAQYPSNPESAYYIDSTNHMLKPDSGVYRDYIRGLKTGSTVDAGRCFVSAAVNKNGETYLGVVLGSPYDAAPDGYAYSFHDTAALYDWIFANFSVRPTLDINSPAGEVPVKLSSDTDAVKLLPAADLKTVLPLENAEGALEKVYDLPEHIDAPVKKGDKVGSLTVKVQGEALGTVDLLAAEDVARNPVLYAGKLIRDFLHSTYFTVVMVLTALFLVAYVLLMNYVKTQNRRKRALQKRRQAQRNAAGMMPQEMPQVPRHAPLPGTGREMPPRSPFGTPMPQNRRTDQPNSAARREGRPHTTAAADTETFFDSDALDFDLSGTPKFDPDAPPAPRLDRRPAPRKPRRRRR